MEEKQEFYHIDPAITIAIVLQIIFMIFTGVAIYNIINRGVGAPGIKINNFSVIPDVEIINEGSSTSNAKDMDFVLDDTAKEVIENTIYDIALMNNNGINIENSGARIREDSVYYVFVEELNAYFLNFIVDVESLSQSYRFVWLFNDSSVDQNSPKVARLMAFCPRKDEMIYGDFDCKDEYDGRGMDIIVYDLVRDHLFNNFTTRVFDSGDDGLSKLEIQLSPGEEPTEEVALQELSGYLSNFGFGLDDFDFETIRLRPYIIRR